MILSLHFGLPQVVLVMLRFPPIIIRQEALNKYYLRQRAQEEVELLHQEMRHVMCSLHNLIDKLSKSLPSMVPSEQTCHELGKTGFINSRINELCARVCHLRKIFSPYYTDDRELPNVSDEYGDDPSEDQDEECQIEIEYWDSVAEEYIQHNYDTTARA